MKGFDESKLDYFTEFHNSKDGNLFIPIVIVEKKNIKRPKRC